MSLRVLKDNVYKVLRKARVCSRHSIKVTSHHQLCTLWKGSCWKLRMLPRDGLPRGVRTSRLPPPDGTESGLPEERLQRASAWSPGPLPTRTSPTEQWPAAPRAPAPGPGLLCRAERRPGTLAHVQPKLAVLLKIFQRLQLEKVSPCFSP